MSLTERVYSILIVSDANSFNFSLKSLLPEFRYSPVHFAESISEAKRDLLDRSYDFVLIHSPLPDGDGTRLAIDLSVAQKSIPLVFVQSECYTAIYGKVAEHGVFVLPRPTSKSTVTQALDWMVACRERLRKHEKKTLSMEEKMAEIRLLNRAKWLLIDKLKMSEPEAHRYIEKQAMDRCISRREMAETIIKTYS